MRSIALGLLLLTAMPASANPCVQMCNLQGDLTVYAHGLALVPTACTYDYATTEGRGVQDPSRFYSIGGDLNWGIRVGGQYASGCWFGGGAYQWYGATETSRIHKATDLIFLRGTDANPVSRAEGRLKWRYQNAEARLGRRFSVGCGEWSLFGTARWADVGLQRFVGGVAVNGSVQESNEKSQFCGGGLGFGLGADLPLLCALHFIGEVQASGLIGGRRTPSATFDLAGTVISGSYPSTTAVVPQLITRVGLAYHLNHGINQFSAFIGYELDQFFGALAFPGDVTQVNQAASFRTCDDLGFAGLFFGVSTTF